MRQLLSLFGCLFFSAVLIAQTDVEPNDDSDQVRYISDNLYTYMHAGPGRNFRILGSVQAGSRVLQLQISDDGEFVEVIDNKQRTGWVDAEFVTTDTSIRSIIPELQQQLRDAEQREQQSLDNIQQLEVQISQLTATNKSLNEQLNTLKNTQAKLDAELSEKNQAEQIEWFTRGGLVALGGLILGVLVTFLPRKKRREDTWM